MGEEVKRLVVGLRTGQVNVDLFCGQFKKLVERRVSLTSGNLFAQLSNLRQAVDIYAAVRPSLPNNNTVEAIGKELFIICARVLLSVPFLTAPKHLELSYFKSSVTKAEDMLRDQGHGHRFAMLKWLMEFNWKHPVLQALITGSKISEKMAMHYITKAEFPEVFRLRVEMLLEEGDHDLALNLCLWCSEDSFLALDPFIRASELILLFNRGHKEVFYKRCRAIYSCTAVEILQSVDPDARSNKGYLTMAQCFFIQEWLRPCVKCAHRIHRYCCTKALLELWLEAEYLQGPTIEEFQLTISHVVQRASSTLQLMLLVDTLYSMFGLELLGTILDICRDALQYNRQLLEQTIMVSEMESERIMGTLAYVCITLARITSEWSGRLRLNALLSAITLEPREDVLFALMADRNSKKDSMATNILVAANKSNNVDSTSLVKVDVNPYSSQKTVSVGFTMTQLYRQEGVWMLPGGVLYDVVLDIVRSLEMLRLPNLNPNQPRHKLLSNCVDHLRESEVSLTSPINIPQENILMGSTQVDLFDPLDLLYQKPVIASLPSPGFQTAHIPQPTSPKDKFNTPKLATPKIISQPPVMQPTHGFVPITLHSGMKEHSVSLPASHVQMQRPVAVLPSNANSYPSKPIESSSKALGPQSMPSKVSLTSNTLLASELAKPVASVISNSLKKQSHQMINRLPDHLLESINNASISVNDKMMLLQQSDPQAVVFLLQQMLQKQKPAMIDLTDENDTESDEEPARPTALPVARSVSSIAEPVSRGLVSMTPSTISGNPSVSSAILVTRGLGVPGTGASLLAAQGAPGINIAKPSSLVPCTVASNPVAQLSNLVGDHVKPTSNNPQANERYDIIKNSLLNVNTVASPSLQGVTKNFLSPINRTPSTGVPLVTLSKSFPVMPQRSPPSLATVVTTTPNIALSLPHILPSKDIVLSSTKPLGTSVTSSGVRLPPFPSMANSTANTLTVFSDRSQHPLSQSVPVGSVMNTTLVQSSKSHSAPSQKSKVHLTPSRLEAALRQQQQQLQGAQSTRNLVSGPKTSPAISSPNRIGTLTESTVIQHSPIVCSVSGVVQPVSQIFMPACMNQMVLQQSQAVLPTGQICSPAVIGGPTAVFDGQHLLGGHLGGPNIFGAQSIFSGQTLVGNEGLIAGQNVIIQGQDGVLYHTPSSAGVIASPRGVMLQQPGVVLPSHQQQSVIIQNAGDLQTAGTLQQVLVASDDGTGNFVLLQSPHIIQPPQLPQLGHLAGQAAIGQLMQPTPQIGQVAQAPQLAPQLSHVFSSHQAGLAASPAVGQVMHSPQLGQIAPSQIASSPQLCLMQSPRAEQLATSPQLTQLPPSTGGVMQSPQARQYIQSPQLNQVIQMPHLRGSSNFAGSQVSKVFAANQMEISLSPVSSQVVKSPPKQKKQRTQQERVKAFSESYEVQQKSREHQHVKQQAKEQKVLVVSEAAPGPVESSITPEVSTSTEVIALAGTVDQESVMFDAQDHSSVPEAITSSNANIAEAQLSPDTNISNSLADKVESRPIEVASDEVVQEDAPPMELNCDQILISTEVEGACNDRQKLEMSDGPLVSKETRKSSEAEDAVAMAAVEPTPDDANDKKDVTRDSGNGISNTDILRTCDVPGESTDDDDTLPASPATEPVADGDSTQDVSDATVCVSPLHESVDGAIVVESERFLTPEDINKNTGAVTAEDFNFVNESNSDKESNCVEESNCAEEGLPESIAQTDVPQNTVAEPGLESVDVQPVNTMADADDVQLISDRAADVEPSELTESVDIPEFSSDMAVPEQILNTDAVIISAVSYQMPAVSGVVSQSMMVSTVPSAQLTEAGNDGDTTQFGPDVSSEIRSEETMVGVEAEGQDLLVGLAEEESLSGQLPELGGQLNLQDTGLPMTTDMNVNDAGQNPEEDFNKISQHVQKQVEEMLKNVPSDGEDHEEAKNVEENDALAALPLDQEAQIQLAESEGKGDLDLRMALTTGEDALLDNAPEDVAGNQARAELEDVQPQINDVATSFAEEPLSIAVTPVTGGAELPDSENADADSDETVEQVECSDVSIQCDMPEEDGAPSNVPNLAEGDATDSNAPDLPKEGATSDVPNIPDEGIAANVPSLPEEDSATSDGPILPDPDQIKQGIVLTTEAEPAEAAASAEQSDRTSDNETLEELETKDMDRSNDTVEADSDGEISFKDSSLLKLDESAWPETPTDEEPDSLSTNEDMSDSPEAKESPLKEEGRQRLRRSTRTKVSYEEIPLVVPQVMKLPINGDKKSAKVTRSRKSRSSSFDKKEVVPRKRTRCSSDTVEESVPAESADPEENTQSATVEPVLVQADQSETKTDPNDKVEETAANDIAIKKETPIVNPAKSFKVSPTLGGTQPQIKQENNDDHSATPSPTPMQLSRNPIRLPRLPRDRLLGQTQPSTPPPMTSSEKRKEMTLISQEAIARVQASISHVDDINKFQDSLIKALEEGIAKRNFAETPKLQVSKDLNSLTILLYYASDQDPLRLIVNRKIAGQAAGQQAKGSSILGSKPQSSTVNRPQVYKRVVGPSAGFMRHSPSPSPNSLSSRSPVASPVAQANSNPVAVSSRNVPEKASATQGHGTGKRGITPNSTQRASTISPIPGKISPKAKIIVNTVKKVVPRKDLMNNNKPGEEKTSENLVRLSPEGPVVKRQKVLNETACQEKAPTPATKSPPSISKPWHNMTKKTLSQPQSPRSRPTFTVRTVKSPKSVSSADKILTSQVKAQDAKVSTIPMSTPKYEKEFENWVSQSTSGRTSARRTAQTTHPVAHSVTNVSNANVSNTNVNSKPAGQGPKGLEGTSYLMSYENWFKGKTYNSGKSVKPGVQKAVLPQEPPPAIPKLRVSPAEAAFLKLVQKDKEGHKTPTSATVDKSSAVSKNEIDTRQTGKLANKPEKGNPTVSESEKIQKGQGPVNVLKDRIVGSAKKPAVSQNDFGGAEIPKTDQMTLKERSNTTGPAKEQTTVVESPVSGVRKTLVTRSSRDSSTEPENRKRCFRDSSLEPRHSQERSVSPSTRATRGRHPSTSSTDSGSRETRSKKSRLSEPELSLRSRTLDSRNTRSSSGKTVQSSADKRLSVETVGANTRRSSSATRRQTTPSKRS